MAPRQKRTFWRRLRIYFRHFRISVWLLVLALLSFVIYLNQVGVPDFVKTPILERLRARGLNLEFSRLRIRWYEGLVADNVRFTRADEGFGPTVTAGEVKLQINGSALWRRRFQVDGLQVRHGRVRWLLGETNAPGRIISIDNIQTRLSFLPGDEWRLDNLKAAFAGGRIFADGTVTNATAISSWKFGSSSGPGDGRLLRERMSRAAEWLEHIRFAQAPEVVFRFSGDANDIRSFGAQLSVKAAGAETPWGRLSQGQLDLKLAPADAGGHSVADLKLQTELADTRWGSISNVAVGLHLSADAANTNLVNASLNLSAGQGASHWNGDGTKVGTRGEWISGSNIVLKADWVHSITNPVPLTGKANLNCGFLASGWGMANSLNLEVADFEHRSRSGDESSFLQQFGLYHFHWKVQTDRLDTEQLDLEKVSCAGNWETPLLTIGDFSGLIRGEQVKVSGLLNTQTRIVSANLESRVDPRHIENLLTQGARKWLSSYSWDAAPQVKGLVQATLPEWQNTLKATQAAWKELNWRALVQPTLVITGKVALPRGAGYKGIEALSATLEVGYSNQVWTLTNLVVTQPEGTLRGEHRASDITKDFYWHLHSNIDPARIRPILQPKEQKVFELLSLSQPPEIEAELWGTLHKEETIRGRASITVSNFAFRGQSAAYLLVASNGIGYTNKILNIREPRIGRGTNEYMSADLVLADFDRRVVYVTNGFSTAEPLAIARAIGPKVGKTLEPYRFDKPPLARVYGTIPMRGEEDADLHFDLQGGPFHWWRFDLPEVSSHVHWRGLHLSLTNLQANFYGGRAAANADFDFPRGGDTQFSFTAVVTNCLLPALVAGVFSSTNKLDGRLDGTVVVTSATDDDWRSVQGYGNLRLRDGLLWDIPVFGMFSPVLDGIVPGLGSSRATAATCTYRMTNGVARSDDLDIRATGMRLMYRGTVDLESRVEAKVEAEVLRDVWVLGPVMSTVLWPVTKMFEYKVSGTLGQPQLQPVYLLPKVVALPFAPFKLLKGLAPGDSTNRNGTNTLVSPKESEAK